MMKKLNKKGFTLAELLIVVAIIAVLVGISIPIFTSQLEKAREATDAANIRSAYAEMSAAVLTDEKVDDTNTDYTVTLTQTQDGWDDKAIKLPSNLTESGTPSAKGTAKLSYDAETGKITVTYAAAKA
jgi:type IV pilus assembly protein PilA